MSTSRMSGAPRRVLTDWTTVAGVDGAGLLALVTGSATAEGIHLATLGYEVFVLHPDQSTADVAEPATHVHHVAADPSDLPQQWAGRFDLVVALDGQVPASVVAAQGIAVVIADHETTIEGLTRVVAEEVDDAGSLRVRTVLARL